MRETWIWVKNSAFKRSAFIVILFLLAFFSAFLWPEPIQDHILPVVDGVINELEYPVYHRIGDIGLYIDNDGEFGYFALTSPGSGWVAIGFSPVDFHMGANFLMFAIVDNESIASDQYGVSQFIHEPDLVLGGTDDIVECVGVEALGTVVEFKFRLNSGDNYDTVLEMGTNYPVIVAYNEIEDDFSMKHSRMYHHTIGILRN